MLFHTLRSTQLRWKSCGPAGTTGLSFGSRFLGNSLGECRLAVYSHAQQTLDAPVAHVLHSLRLVFSDLARPRRKSREAWAPAERREIRASAAAPDCSAEVSDRVAGFACQVAARAAGAAARRPWGGAVRRDRACTQPGPAPVARLPFAGSRVSRSRGRGAWPPTRVSRCRTRGGVPGPGVGGLWAEGPRGRGRLPPWTP